MRIRHLALTFTVSITALGPLGAQTVSIPEIQGAGHRSPLEGQTVNTRGYISKQASDGFYLLDQSGDGDARTSDGIFVHTGEEETTPVGTFVEVRGTVEEFVPGGEDSNNLSITRLEFEHFLPSVINPPAYNPAPVVIGEGGILPPSSVVENDSFAEFDPEEDGLDFYEALEGMLVTVEAPLAVCPSNAHGEIYVVANNGEGATGLSARGTLNLAPGDYNPERIQVQQPTDNAINTIKVGDRLSDITGIVSYDGMYEVLSQDALELTAGALTPQVTSLGLNFSRVRIASFNLKELDPVIETASLTDQTDGLPNDDVDDDVGNGRFAAIAEQIVANLQSPAIIALQKVQDNDGAEISNVTTASQTLQRLVSAIKAAGGPTYFFLDAPNVVPATINDNETPGDPSDDFIDNPSGGQAGGNQRNVFLFDPTRVALVQNSLTILADPDLNDGDAFANCPQPLQVQFEISGERLTIINTHLSDREGGSSVFGAIQPAVTMMNDPSVNGRVDERISQSEVLADHVSALLEDDAHVVLLGDFNDPEFLSPTTTLAKTLINLSETLPNHERYSVISQGNSEAVDHIFVGPSLMENGPRYQIIHTNCEFPKTPGSASNHDPVMVSLGINAPYSFEARTITGTGNNLSNPEYGEAGRIYIRNSNNGVAEFEDGLNYPRGSNPDLNPNPFFIAQSKLPSPRIVSNILSTHPGGQASAARLSSWTWQWGQFIDHDFGLGGGPDEGAREFFPIPVPSGDPDFDPFGTGTQIIPFGRSGFAAGTGVTTQRETPNLITSFIDGSAVYGSDHLRAHNLRSFTGGHLAAQSGPDGELPPFNVYGRGNANDLGLPAEDLLLAGDVRANEQCALAAAHTLFLREHNRLADEIAAQDFAGENLSDPEIDEEIYQRARKFVGAYVQAITYEEFLPAVLGPNALPSYQGYDPSVDASLSQEFANGAFRVGHTMVTSELLRFDDEGNPLPQGHLSLRNAFFNPPEVTEIGIDPYLRGLARQVQQEVDRFVIDDVRSFLFGPPGAGGLDLAALNIQRGRDHGLPSFNQVRASFGLPPILAYPQLSQDSGVVVGMASLYKANIASLDLWIAGICEDHAPGSQLGATFHAIWVDQFTRLRDGDRFWYENDPFFSAGEVAAIRNTRLSDIIARNSGAQMQENVFYVPEPLKIVAIAFERATNEVTLTWNSVEGIGYEIQASNDLGASIPFATIEQVTGQAGTTTARFVDPPAGDQPRRSYRILQR